MNHKQETRHVNHNHHHQHHNNNNNYLHVSSSTKTIYPPPYKIISIKPGISFKDFFFHDNSGDSNTKSSRSAQVNWSPDARQGLSNVSQGPLSTTNQPTNQPTNQHMMTAIRGGEFNCKVVEE